MSDVLVTFEGKIGKDPELKGEGDKSWTGFGIATERWVGEGKGDVRDNAPTAYKTTWINVVAFGRQAQYLAERFRKGDTIAVLQGNLEVSTYEKKDNDGNVIDGSAQGLRVILQKVAGPFRSAPKADDSGASNGNSNGYGNQAPQPQNQPQGRASAPQQGRQQSAPPPRQQSRPAAAPQQRQAQAPPPPPASQQNYSDDIPF